MSTTDIKFILKQSATTKTITPQNNILKSGEAAYSHATGDSGGGDRLFIGAGGNDSANGFAQEIHTIGGKYYTDMMDHPKGQVKPSSAVITDANNKIDVLNVDNVSIDGNEISATGNLTVNPSGGTIDASTSTISNVVDPTNPQDAATKNYVDTIDMFFAGADNNLSGTGDISKGDNLLVSGGSNVNTTRADLAQGAQVFVHLDSAVSGLASIEVDNIRIDGNTISTTSGNMILDPTPGGAAGTLIVQGNLQVDGTTTTINSTTLTVDDKNIELAQGAADAASADSAGITIQGANAQLFYKSNDDAWHVNKKFLAPNIDVTGTISTTSFAGKYLGFDSDFAQKSTSDLTEGTNLYYTDTRFDTRLGTKTTDDVAEGSTNKYFNGKSTTDLPEGTNLYYTIQRVRDVINLVDVSGDGSLTYDSSTGTFTYTGPSAAEVRAHFAASGDLSYDSATGTFSIDVEQVYSKANFDSDLGDATTDGLPEGVTNLYYTTARFDTAFSGKTTTDLTEGNNLYYTKARVDSDISTSLNDSGNTVNVTINNVIEDKVDSAYVLARIAAAPFLDSADAILLIDSAYVQARQVDLQRDSAFVTNIVDAAYVQARQVDLQRDSGFITNIIDSDYVLARAPAQDFVDSAEIIALIDSSYIQARQSQASGTDSSAVLTLIDSAHVRGLVDSAYIKTVTGIDADTLDGQQGTFYLDYNNFTNTPTTVDLTDVANLVDSSYVRTRVRTNQDLYTTSTVTFNEIRGPADFTIDPAATGDATGTVQILGNLRVEGTTTTIQSTTVSLNDKNLVLADSAQTAGDADGAGITINGANASLTYAATGDKFVFNKGFEGTWLSLETSVDSAYVNARVAAGTDSATVLALINSTVDSAYVNIRLDSAERSNVAQYLGRHDSSYYLDYNNLVNTPSAPPTINKAYVDALNINADTLDGQHGSYYSDYVNLSNKPTILSANDVKNLFNASGDNEITTGAVVGLSYLEFNHDSDAQVLAVDVASKTAAHRYQGNGSSLGYRVDGTESPFLQFAPGNKYRFDQSNGTNANHPILFYYDAQKSTQYTSGVTVNGIAGQAGAYTEIEIMDDTPPVLFYQCQNHGFMGNAIFTQTRNLTGFSTSNLGEGTNLYYTNQRVQTFVDSAYVAARAPGTTFGLAANTGTHTFNPTTETLTFLGTTGQINAGIAANNVTLELDQNINSITSIAFEGDSTNNNETKIQAVNPTKDNVINLPDSSGTIALLSDITGGAGGGGGLDSAAVINLVDSDYVTARFTGSGISLAQARNGLSVVTSAPSASGGLTYNNANGIFTFSPVTQSSGGGGGVDVTDFRYTATAAQTVFTGADANGNTLSYNVTDDHVNVYVNGILLVETVDYAKTDASTVTLTTGTNVNDVVQIIKFAPAAGGGGGSGGGVDSAATLALIDSAYIQARVSVNAAGTLEINKFFFEADSGDTVFSGADKFGNTLNVTPANVEVYLNGILQELSTDYSVSQAAVTFTEALDSGFSVSVIETIGRANVQANVLTDVVYEYDADSGQTIFTGPDRDSATLDLSQGTIDVYLNGILLSDTNDYVASETSITLLQAADSGDFIAISNKKGSTVSGMNTFQYVFTNLSGATQLSGNGLAYTGKVQVFKNGSILRDGTDFTATDGSTVQLTASTVQSDVYVVQTFTGKELRAKGYDFVATAGQSIFNGPDRFGASLAYNRNEVIVFLNGVALVDSADYTASSGNSITLTTPAALNDELKVITYVPQDLSSIASDLNLKNFEFTADSGQSTFTGADDNGSTLVYTAGLVNVSLNGLLLKSSDFTSTDGSTVVLTEAADSGDILIVTRLTGNNLGGLDSANVNDAITNTVTAPYIAALGFGNTSGTDSATVQTMVDSALFNWQEASVGVTLVAGQKTIVDTSTTPITIGLPTGTFGNEVRIIDGYGNAATNNITIQSSQKIIGSDSDLIININRAAIGLVYYNDSNGWILTEN